MVPALLRLDGCADATQTASMESSSSFRIQKMAEPINPTATGDDDEEQPHKAQADRIVELVWKENVTLFQDQYGDPYARLKNGEHWEIHRLRGRHFRRWLCRLLWQAEHKAPNANAIISALAVLEGKSCFECPCFPLENRTARDDVAIYYDLTNENWEVVKITAGGWEVMKTPPILFRRHAHEQPQVTPVRGGSVELLLPFLNLAEPRFVMLLLVYLVTCLIPGIPHPVPVFHGPQGSAKTTLARMLRLLVDPSSMGTLSLPTTNAELAQQLSHHWFAFFDNVTSLPGWASDALCRGVTGDGFSKRELYSDDDDVIYAFQRCIGLNGINLAAQKPDLLDRALLFRLERIPKESRKSEEDLWEAFMKARPLILGGMFDALSTAMQMRGKIRLAEMPRMADFAHWGCSIAEAMGFSQAEFLAAYFANIGQQHEEVVQENVVAAAIMAFTEGGKTWEGTASELLNALCGIAEAEKIDTHSKWWPKAPNSLSRRLNEVRTNLAEVGIVVELLHDSSGRRCIRITRERKGTDDTGDVSGRSSPSLLPDL